MSKKEKKSSAGKNFKYIGGLLLKKMARGGARQLRSNAEEVNKLNVFPVPDGDTGDNMRMTIESGITAIENIDSDNLADVMKALSHGMLLGARGNSGVILSQFFAGTAKGLETQRYTAINSGMFRRILALPSLKPNRYWIMVKIPLRPAGAKLLGKTNS